MRADCELIGLMGAFHDFPPVGSVPGCSTEGKFPGRHKNGSAHPSFVVVRGRITPIAVIAGLAIMILALVYLALNRSHALALKAPPIHQAR